MASATRCRSAKVGLHLRASEIQVAILQPHFFIRNRFFRRRKGRYARVIQHQKLVGDQLHFACRHLRIDGARIAAPQRAFGSHDIFWAHMLGLRVAFPREVLVQNDLSDSGAVAQVEKDEVAVVATAVDPTHQHDRLAGVFGAKLPTGMGALQCSKKVEQLRFLLS